MMNNSREEILYRIRQGLKETSVPIPEGKTFKVASEEIATAINKEQTELKKQFITELRKVNTNVIEAANESEIKNSLDNLIKDKKIKSFSIWEFEYLKKLNLKQDLKHMGLKLIAAKNKNRIAESDIGITQVDYAIADTGTLVLLTNKNQPRTVSLLPPIHLAIVRPENLVRNISDLFIILKSKLQQGQDLTNCMTFITGPSRTADIELNLTLGVHGPKELYVFI